MSPVQIWASAPSPSSNSAQRLILPPSPRLQHDRGRRASRNRIFKAPGFEVWARPDRSVTSGRLSNCENPLPTRTNNLARKEPTSASSRPSSRPTRTRAFPPHVRVPTEVRPAKPERPPRARQIGADRTLIPAISSQPPVVISAIRTGSVATVTTIAAWGRIRLSSETARYSMEANTPHADRIRGM